MPVRARPRREADGGNSFLQTGTICGVFRRRSRRGRRHTPDFSQSGARHSAVCVLRLHGRQAHLRRVGRSREAYAVSVRMHRPGVHGTFRPPPSAEERDPRNRRGAMRRTTCVRKSVPIRVVRRQGGAGDTLVQSSILRNSSQLASGSPWRNRRVRMPKRAAASRLAGRSSMKSVSSGARP